MARLLAIASTGRAQIRRFAPQRLCACRRDARPIGVSSLSARPHRTARRHIRRHIEPITRACRADTAPNQGQRRTVDRSGSVVMA